MRLSPCRDAQLAEASGENPGCEWRKTELSCSKSHGFRLMSCGLGPKARIRSTELCRLSSKARRPFSPFGSRCALLCVHVWGSRQRWQ